MTDLGFSQGRNRQNKTKFLVIHVAISFQLHQHISAFFMFGDSESDLRMWVEGILRAEICGFRTFQTRMQDPTPR